MKKKPLIYLAAPYWHPEPLEIESRFCAMNKITAQIISEQDAVIPFSPISYTHRISHHCEDDFDWYTWDLQFLARCEGMIIMMLDGWEESKGIQIEIGFCKRHGIPYTYSTPEKILRACRWLADWIKENEDM